MHDIRLAESTLLIVDAQRGFSELAPKELPVPGALRIVPVINQLLGLAWKRIDASQDWHPPDHCSFFGRRDNLYPPHCVVNTWGADFLPGLKTERFHTIWRKGFDRDVESYAITAQHAHYPSLLEKSGLRAVVVCGLAANICCHYSACDLRKAGFRVLLVEDASAGLDVPTASLLQHKAKEEGRLLGIEYVFSQELIAAAK